MKNYKLKYGKPANLDIIGWEKYSLPIGNGYFGASVFGGVDKEKVQFTTNAFANTYSFGGVSNFLELTIESQESYSEYERCLDLNNGISYSHYTTENAITDRECFFSYPDNVFVYRIKSEAEKNIIIRLEIPFLNSRPITEGGREGRVFTKNGEIFIEGALPLRNLTYGACLAVITDGKKVQGREYIKVKGAKDVVILITMGTSYKLCSETFILNKAVGEKPFDSIQSGMQKAKNLGYEALRDRHVQDFSELVNRVEFDLGGIEDERFTDQLIESYKKGNKEPFLEELYYQYGRYLLISSSRKNTLPSSLQGVWTAHEKSPWGSGFWHNINIQMNYWHAFSANIAETFDAYAGFFKAYLPAAKENAKQWISQTNPENAGDDCGWIIGTGAFAYEVEGKNDNSHSGPGTGGLTAKLFFDAYDFTRDEEFLREYAYPAVHGAAKFLKNCLRAYDTRMLASFSASPEQILSGEWVIEHKQQQYYHTVGCSFDQQMIKEVFEDDLKLSEILGVWDEVNEFEKQNLEKLDAIRVGYSGQIKEYDEELFYGEIGEAKHRHLSQLVALMPGQQITKETPAYLDSAIITLNLRGDKSTGWALAHRLCLWARAGYGERAYSLLKTLLKEKTHPNLWDVHPPFQIDGNFGATAGITEMLIQSHGGVIELLPSLPSEWGRVRFSGLKARGNFTISLAYDNGEIEYCKVYSCIGGKVKIFYEHGFNDIKVKCGEIEKEAIIKGETIAFETDRGNEYEIVGFRKREIDKIAEDFDAIWTEDGVLLKWKEDGQKYQIYRAEGNFATYKLVAKSVSTPYVDKEFNIKNKARLTYKIVKDGHKCYSKGTLAILDPATELQKERYLYKFKLTNMNIKQ